MQGDSVIHAQAEDNVRKIDAELDSLRSRLSEPRINYPEFWNHVKEINAHFRSLTPLTKESRDRLWAELGTVCEAAKSKQAERHRDFENRKQTSRNKRNLVESKIHEAYHQAKGGRSADELAKARQLLKEALAWMKGGWSEFNIPTQLFALDDGKMTKEDHDACWEKWQEANTMLESRRQEVGEHNFDHYQNEAHDAINLAGSDPKQAKERVKRIQEPMRGLVMTGDQFSEIRRLLDQAWQHATHAQSQRQDEWRDRQHGYIQTKSALIELVCPTFCTSGLLV